MSDVAAPAIVLLSGGMDSATTLAIARDQGFACHALTFRYGQVNDAEIAAAETIASHLAATSHRIVDLDLAQFGGSALLGDGEIPTSQSSGGTVAGIPTTYVPARNTVFLSIALAAAEACGATDIFLGVNAVDYSGYPDCRPEYIKAFEHMANLATKVGVESGSIVIHAPLIDLTKVQIILRGQDHGVNFDLTISCYQPGDDNSPCEVCDSCQLRNEAFALIAEQ
jgi:7-cyano-7-deazaguanine synthase